MEGLTALFSSPLFSKGAPLALAGAGEIGNIMEERKRLAYQNFVMDLLKNPAKLAAMAAKIQQPLNNGLVQGVTNQVQGDMASRGLSQAPGIFAATESQALAPFEQQNQQTAMNAFLQSLGLPAGTFGKPTDIGSILSMFKGGSSGGGSSSSLFSDPGLSIMQPSFMPGGGGSAPPFDPTTGMPSDFTSLIQGI
jgi:hypothetical protein